ncbi:cupin domain-containing protein [Streptomyces profundus]|uniref:cupin domain-containing protein n=1 Tax=Streptomyces profundus TaxID=2867410 RepID=UPI001D15E659|nr:cupin domain-containing protein [Streptomyces sp. MA3_2.13]
MRGGRPIRRAGTFAALAGPLVLVAFPSASVAGSGGQQRVQSETLAEGVAPHGVRIEAEGPTDVVQRVITIEPGGSTGWHYHDGPLLAVIASGTLTRTLEDCTVEVSHAGDSFVEPHGPGHVHVGRNLGDEPVVLYATYMVPQGAPLSVDAEDPGCPG